MNVPNNKHKINQQHFNGHEKERKSARHNLLSIYFDTKNFLWYGLKIFLHESTCSSLKNKKRRSNNNHSTTPIHYHDDEQQECPPQKEQQHTSMPCPIVANERCGLWYAYPYANTAPNTHFKSTDGHKNINNFSLKRLNFNFLSAACSASRSDDHDLGDDGGSGGGAIFIVDASKYKRQPDSFSRTLPIWCCVLNRIVAAFREKYNDHPRKDADGTYIECEENGCNTTFATWDVGLYTPSDIISEEEHDSILDIIPQRVQSALNSGVIIDELQFMNMITKPLRCFWIQNDGVDDGNESKMEQKWKDLYETIQQYKSSYTCIICVSVSESGILDTIPHYRPNTSILDNKDHDLETLEWFYYKPGAADDHELSSWAKGLTPQLFWKHCDDILLQPNMTVQDTDEAIKSLMRRIKRERFDVCDDNEKPFDTIGDLNISIGSRISGRPPLCWDHFDAILNVSELEYEGLLTRTHVNEGKYYLRLHVKEGKKDRTELEKWMAVAMIFIGVHAAASNRRVLVHCAQGVDRSVAMVLAAICMFCELRTTTSTEGNESKSYTRKTLGYHSWCSKISVDGLTRFIEERKLNEKFNNQENSISVGTDDNEHLCSGLPTDIVKKLMGRRGKDLLFHYIRAIDGSDEKYFATKESMRVALMAIKQFRDKACPSRSTMQKLNRFFMSNLDENL